MFNTTKTILAQAASRLALTGAAAGLVFAPIAVQAQTASPANTRAGDGAPVYQSEPASQPGTRRDDDDDDDDSGFIGIPFGIAALFAAAASAGTIAIVADGDDDNIGNGPGDNDQSPGT